MGKVVYATSETRFLQYRIVYHTNHIVRCRLCTLGSGEVHRTSTSGISKNILPGSRKLIYYTFRSMLIMVLPTFEDIMLPLLELVSDGSEKNYSEVTSHVADHFQLSQEDLEMEKPSGGNYLYNRITWTKIYLTKANLLEKKAGKFKITKQGLDILKQKHPKITRILLANFGEFAQYSPESKKNLLSDGGKTPDDLINEGMTQINDILSMNLLAKLKTVEPSFFEKIVLDVVEKLGYGKGKHVGKSGDGGIDGEIPQDKLGLDMIYLQVKRYSHNVTPREIREFAGALTDKKSQKGIFVTTSDFPKEACKDMKDSGKNIILINGEQLVRYMIEYNVGVDPKEPMYIKKMDDSYFEEQ